MNVYNNFGHNHQKTKINKCLSTVKWVNTVCRGLTVQYYSARKKNEQWIHATVWMNLIGITLIERRQVSKSAYYMILYMEHPGKRISYREQISGLPGMRGEKWVWLEWDSTKVSWSWQNFSVIMIAVEFTWLEFIKLYIPKKSVLLNGHL